MEIFDLYTKDRTKTPRTMVRGDKVPDGYFRLVVHACIFNSRGEMLIQQRQPFKKGWSNLWDITMGGAVTTGETTSVAVERELHEELGIDISSNGVRPVLTVNFEHGFDDYYVFKKDLDINGLRLQPEEVQAAKWADMDEIFAMIDDGRFIPYHKSLIELLFMMKDHTGAEVGEDTTKPFTPSKT